MLSCPEPVFVAILWLFTCVMHNLTYDNYLNMSTQHTFVKNKLHTYGINPQADSESGLKPATQGNAKKQGASASFSFEAGISMPDFLESAVNLTLMERENRPGRPPLFWVMPVIREGQWAEVPENAP